MSADLTPAALDELNALIAFHAGQEVMFDLDRAGEIRCTISHYGDGRAFGIGFGDDALTAMRQAIECRVARLSA